MGGQGTQGQGYVADINSITEAQARIAPYVHKTPVLSSTSIDAIAGKQLLFKCECFQKTGAFKIRGAFNAIFALDNDQTSKGVVTHTSGNYGAAVALAAKLRGIPAYIVIPKNAPACKAANIKRYGGQLTWCDANIEARESAAKRVQEETGAFLIDPFNDKYTISGQGTVSLEFLEQVPELDTIIVPISSGTLASGVALAAKAINPSIRIIAVEPKGADDAAQSKAAGRLIKLATTNTIASGLGANSLGDLTWPVVRDLVDDIIVVDDNDIVDAMKMFYEMLKVAVEPSGAIGLAASLSNMFKQSSSWHESSKIGIIVTGGNVDLRVLWDSLYK